MIKIIQIALVYILTLSSVFAEELSIIPWKSNKLYNAFNTWEFSFTDINLYIIYLIDVLSVVAVVVSLLFVLIWWFRCVMAFWSSDKWDWAKKTVFHALLWLWISTLAWVIVEIALKIISA